MKEKQMREEKRFYIKGSGAERPKSQCTIYVDGASGDEFREGTDVELSHWLPNRTEDRYKAGTSTEICFKFLEANKSHSYDLVVNNHLDMDGLLSVFVLVYPSVALYHREILSNAAKAGDFWAWSEGKALKIFQEVTLFYRNLEKQEVNLQKAFESCFERILMILKGSTLKADVQPILESQPSFIEQGKIQRQELASRFVMYYVPRDLSKGRMEGFLGIPEFNEPLSDRLAFWPQVRNRWDEEKIQLIAIESEKGIHYDLWYPGYVWADTHGLWRPPGLTLPLKADESHRIDWPDLSKVIEELNGIETGFCEWKLFSGLRFSGQENPRGFPIVASTLGRQNEKQESHLSLERVSRAFLKLF